MSTRFDYDPIVMATGVVPETSLSELEQILLEQQQKQASVTQMIEGIVYYEQQIKTELTTEKAKLASKTFTTTIPFWVKRAIYESPAISEAVVQFPSDAKVDTATLYLTIDPAKSVIGTSYWERLNSVIVNGSAVAVDVKSPAQIPVGANLIKSGINTVRLDYTLGAGYVGNLGPAATASIDLTVKYFASEAAKVISSGEAPTKEPQKGGFFDIFNALFGGLLKGGAMPLILIAVVLFFVMSSMRRS